MNCSRRYAKVLRVRQLSPTEWAVLGLLSRGPQHGFALAKHLSCGGGFGHVWTVQRPLVYRALDTLRADGLVECLSAEPGDGGPPRRKMVITERGSALLLEWVRVPVKHIRDSRSRLLLKLAINDDLGLDSTPLIKSQIEVLKAIEHGLELHLAQASVRNESVALLYRLESARALQRFLAQLVPA
jgi:DNA-binding PadR family transcriptional regulator